MEEQEQSCNKCEHVVETLKRSYAYAPPSFRLQVVFEEMAELNFNCSPDLVCMPLCRLQREMAKGKH